MTHEARCNSCQAAIDPANIDRERDLATCSRCGRLVDLRAPPTREAAVAATNRPRSRARVQLPTGMSFTSMADRIVIRRRWLRQKHWFLLCIIGAAGAYAAYLWSTLEATPWLVIGTLFVLSWNYALAAMFVNSTTITAGADGVTVQHGPLPSPFARNAAAKPSQIRQLYSSKHGALFAVQAKLNAGEPLRLVAPLITPEQALFVEQQLERALGLVDAAVEGELGSAGAVQSVDGKSPGGAASGAVLALVIPVFIVATIGLFVFVSSTDVSGRLQASGALGTWTFEPDDCDSGQHEGFGGVILKASKQRGRFVRVVRDPVRGTLVVVASPGSPNHVLSADTCQRFNVQVTRGNTNINDVWTQDGSATLECETLSGAIKFAGCH